MGTGAQQKLRRIQPTVASTTPHQWTTTRPHHHMKITTQVQGRTRSRWTRAATARSHTRARAVSNVWTKVGPTICTICTICTQMPVMGCNPVGAIWASRFLRRILSSGFSTTTLSSATRGLARRRSGRRGSRRCLFSS